MSNFEDEARARAQAKVAQQVNDRTKQMIAEGAKKAAQQAINVESYSEATMIHPSLRSQMVARLQALQNQGPSAVDAARKFDVANAVANLRAEKGMVAPDSEGTEHLPTIEELLERHPVEDGLPTTDQEQTAPSREATYNMLTQLVDAKIATDNRNPRRRKQ